VHEIRDEKNRSRKQTGEGMGVERGFRPKVLGLLANLWEKGQLEGDLGETGPTPQSATPIGEHAKKERSVGDEVMGSTCKIR